MKKNNSLLFLIVIVVSFFSINLLSVFLKFSNFTETSFISLKQAVDYLFKAEDKAKALDLNQAAQNFANANQIFQEIQSTAWVFENQLISPTQISEAGEIITKVGKDLLILSQSLQDFPQQFFELNKNQLLSSSNQSSELDIVLTDKIQQTKDLINKSQSDLKKAQTLLESQSINLLPSSLRSKYRSGLYQIQELQEVFLRVDKILVGVLDLLGHRTSHRYLVLLQNQNELRPLGGFLGGVMTFEVDRGMIKNLKFLDIYDIDGQTTKTLDVPPEFDGFTDKIFSRDANFTPSLSISGNRINNLHQFSKQPNYQTILSLNHSILSKILVQTGPIQVNIQDKKYLISDQNFSLFLNTLIEIDQNKNIVEPIIQDIQIALFEKLSFPQIANLIFESLEQKDILFYTQNQNIYTEYKTSPFYNEKIPHDTDFILLTQTNIGGNKSDQYIQNNIKHQTTFTDKNTQLHELTINRTNLYSNQLEIKNLSTLSQFGINQIPDDIRYILGRGTNKVAFKVYVPKNANLITWQGDIEHNISTHIDYDLDLKYFLFVQTLDPQQSKQVSISYQTKQNILSKTPIQVYDFNVLKSFGFSYNFAKTFQHNQKYPVYLNTPSFNTLLNTPFRVESEVIDISKDKTFSVILYK